MKFTLSWLKEHLDTDASVTEIAETLTDLGLEVEEVTDPAAKLSDFTIGEILQFCNSVRIEKVFNYKKTVRDFGIMHG